METHKTTSIMVFNKNGQVLLQKRDNIPNIKEPGKWDFWGGHCEKGETPKICAIRELEEETSIRIKDSSKFKFIMIRRFGNTEESVFAHLFEFEYKPQVYEGERSEWFDPEEARKLSMAFGAEILFKKETIEKVKENLF
ncbi:MAG: NUDIX domain-containing protein [Patescibacteria group bacterium]|nr:NUDIX domain-containing protein [Patescibacteria group bacterium]